MLRKSVHRSWELFQVQPRAGKSHHHWQKRHLFLSICQMNCVGNLAIACNEPREDAIAYCSWRVWTGSDSEIWVELLSLPHFYWNKLGEFKLRSLNSVDYSRYNNATF